MIVSACIVFAVCGDAAPGSRRRHPLPQPARVINSDAILTASPSSLTRQPYTLHY